MAGDVGSAQAGGPMDLRLNAYGSLRGGGEWSFEDDTVTVSDDLRPGGGGLESIFFELTADSSREAVPTLEGAPS